MRVRYFGFLAMTLIMVSPRRGLAQGATAHGTDFSQAWRMLAYLKAAVSGHHAAALADSVLANPATALIIEQQNISRRVTPEQYRAVLIRAADAVAPGWIRPADPGERAARGVEGLVHDVWPSLRWGTAHTDLLADRLEQLQRADVLDSALALAVRFLPPGAAPRPRSYVVMGGRAGAAALDSDAIYFDILAMSYHAAIGILNAYPTPPVVVEFFAHEMHHQGLGAVIDGTARTLRLGPQDSLAFHFLSSLVLEGSASYFINGHRSLAVLESDSEFAPGLRDREHLLRSVRQVLDGVVNHGLKGEAYQAALATFTGSGYHAAGATMIAAIDRQGGFEAVLPVLVDPRRLLSAYDAVNGARAATPGLAEELLRMGRSGA